MNSDWLPFRRKPFFTALKEKMVSSIETFSYLTYYTAQPAQQTMSNDQL